MDGEESNSRMVRLLECAGGVPPSAFRLLPPPFALRSPHSTMNSSWIFFLLSEKFFSPCHLHPHARKNEKNIFCLDCCLTLCPHCLPLHDSHRLLQVRRYVYNDVVRLDDMEKLFDCRFVQLLQFLPENSSRAVPILLSSLQGTACRRHGTAGFEYIYDCECLQPLDLGCANLEESQMTPSSVLDAEVSFRNTTSSGSCSDGDGGVGCLNVGCTATTEKVTRKKRSTRVAVANFCDRITPRSVSKRKGLPLRSPLY
ncbi:hypothetical protein CK203_104837 [Vitis vinifera]|uniref:B box-type domain-containing protein n=1 Tax=Vitis vinifera TaxID=29760 RepID=A0A438CDV7_VITVI|nr:hypothetical protein CK203_104837 [Vitis vinifera]